MTVRELIAELIKMPQNEKVLYYDGDNGWTEPKVEYIKNAPRSYYHLKGEKIGSIVSLTGD